MSGDEGLTRRKLLQGIGTGAATGLSGCLNIFGGSEYPNTTNPAMRKEAKSLENYMKDELDYAAIQKNPEKEGILDIKSADVDFEVKNQSKIDGVETYSTTAEIDLAGPHKDIQGYIDENAYRHLLEDLKKPAWDIFWGQMQHMSKFDPALRDIDQDKINEYNIRFNGENQYLEHSLTSEEVSDIIDLAGSNERGMLLEHSYYDAFHGNQDWEGIKKYKKKNKDKKKKKNKNNDWWNPFNYF